MDGREVSSKSEEASGDCVRVETRDVDLEAGNVQSDVCAKIKSAGAEERPACAAEGDAVDLEEDKGELSEDLLGEAAMVVDGFLRIDFNGVKAGEVGRDLVSRVLCCWL